MKVNGRNIFLGAYAERKQSSYLQNQTSLSLGEERAAAITAGMKEAFHSLNLQNKGVKVSVSQTDMDFLCSEEGFLKMKQDALDLYTKNYNQQKVIAKDRNPEDLFWSNTGNQWLVFSEALYDNDFYAKMSDAEVKEFEDTLAYITSGMDCLSRSQYLTGIEFSSFKEEYKYFMSSSEAALELESSVAALQYLSDTFLPKEQQDIFNKLVDMYDMHNKEILAEYSNPVESFNKVIAGIYTKKNLSSGLLKQAADKPEGEYKYTVMLGRIEKSEQEKEQYREKLQVLFDKLGNHADKETVWKEISECFKEYATGGSRDAAFRNYVFDEAQYLFHHMKNCWSRLADLNRT